MKKVLAAVALVLAMAVPLLARAQMTAPVNLRADISDGTTGQLFVSWNMVAGAGYYNLFRALTPTGPWTLVTSCSGSANARNLGTPWTTRACRDGGLTPGTTYYYQVQACDSTGCGPLTTNTAGNTPISCDCTAKNIPSVIGLHPGKMTFLTSTVTPGAIYKSTALEDAGYPAAGVPYRGILAINLPGSGESAGVVPWVWEAQNLGFDMLSVNYDSKNSQEDICQAVGGYITTADQAAQCFTNISQAKFDFTGPCIPGGTANRTNCGTVPGTTQPYTVPVPQDDITVRVGTLLQYLWCNGYDTAQTLWENYLAAGTTCQTSNPIPNWSRMILGGHSQGGGMATFIASETQIVKTINLSAPAQATPVNGTMVPGSYFVGFASQRTPTSVERIYGFVSQNDTRYTSGVFQSIWQAIGYNSVVPLNPELQLNVAGSGQGLICGAVATHNLSTDDAGPGTGHDDPIYIWNEDVFEFMLNN